MSPILASLLPPPCHYQTPTMHSFPYTPSFGFPVVLPFPFSLQTHLASLSTHPDIISFSALHSLASPPLPLPQHFPSPQPSSLLSPHCDRSSPNLAIPSLHVPVTLLPLLPPHSPRPYLQSQVSIPQVTVQQTQFVIALKEDGSQCTLVSVDYQNIWTTKPLRAIALK